MNNNLQIRIAPSILSCDFGIFAQECKRMLQSGADSLHFDIMDGHFVPNLTIGPSIVKSVVSHLPNNTHIDCHLMVTRPEEYIEPLAKAKVSNFTFHYQSEYSDLESVCKKIKDNKMSAGISIKPKTQINDKIKNLIENKLLDLVLVMSVQPGFGGQSFMGEMMQKVKDLRQLFPLLNIQVDGGVVLENVNIVAESGANCIVSGTGIFGSKDPKHTMSEMKKIIQKSLKRN